jgi:divalent metal cation (Fe/Co/Zn/Cd) transporter
MMDGVAAALIGLLLLAVAVFLANETRSLLTGEAASPALVAALRSVLASDPTVAGVNATLTMHLGPRDILLAASLDFEDGLDSGVVEAAVARLDARIKQAHPAVTRVFDAARRAPASGAPGPASPGQ